MLAAHFVWAGLNVLCLLRKGGPLAVLVRAQEDGPLRARDLQGP